MVVLYIDIRNFEQNWNLDIRNFWFFKKTIIYFEYLSNSSFYKKIHFIYLNYILNVYSMKREIAIYVLKPMQNNKSYSCFLKK